MFQTDAIENYQRARLTAFLDPQNASADVRYNLDQSLIAVGSGGLTGKGYLNGTQTNLDYVPEQHTDFIFTVAGEEFGFVGAIALLALFALLLWRAIRIAWLAKDPFGTYVAAGIASMFAIQMFVNVGMVIGIMPITGIPLPFLSYGGTVDPRELRRRGDAREHPHAPVHLAAVRTPEPPQERRALGPGVLEDDVAVHRVRRHPGERQPDPDALVDARVQVLGLLERLEDPRRRVRVDAGALVDHADLDAVRRSRPGA